MSDVEALAEKIERVIWMADDEDAIEAHQNLRTLLGRLAEAQGLVVEAETRVRFANSRVLKVEAEAERLQRAYDYIMGTTERGNRRIPRALRDQLQEIAKP